MCLLSVFLCRVLAICEAHGESPDISRSHGLRTKLTLRLPISLCIERKSLKLVGLSWHVAQRQWQLTWRWEEHTEYTDSMSIPGKATFPLGKHAMGYCPPDEWEWVMADHLHALPRHLQEKGWCISYYSIAVMAKVTDWRKGLFGLQFQRAESLSWWPSMAESSVVLEQEAKRSHVDLWAPSKAPGNGLRLLNLKAHPQWCILQ